MSITYSKLFEDWNDVLKDLNSVNFANTFGTLAYTVSNEKEYTLELPLVGVSKEELKIEMIMVRGSKNVSIKTEPKTVSKLVKPLHFSYSLADDADIDNVNAKLENGLLTVRVPKIRPEKKTVKVDIV